MAIMVMGDLVPVPVLIVACHRQGLFRVCSIVMPDGPVTTCHEDWLCMLEDYSPGAVMPGGGFVRAIQVTKRDG